MSDAHLRWLQDAVSVFGAECRRILAGPGDREAAIRTPLEQLFRTIGAHSALPEVTWHPETRGTGLGESRIIIGNAATKAVTSEPCIRRVLTPTGDLRFHCDRR